MNFLTNFIFTIFLIFFCSALLFYVWNWAMESFGGNSIALQDMSGYSQPPGDDESRIPEPTYRDDGN